MTICIFNAPSTDDAINVANELALQMGKTIYLYHMYGDMWRASEICKVEENNDHTT